MVVKLLDLNGAQWEATASSTVYREWIDDESGLKGIVKRGPGALCGYIAIPLTDDKFKGFFNKDCYSHPDYPDVHGGITYSNEGSEWSDSVGYWVIGWDYAHLNDHTCFANSAMNDGYITHDIEDVEHDVKQAIDEIKQLVRARNLQEVKDDGSFTGCGVDMIVRAARAAGVKIDPNDLKEPTNATD